MTEPMTEPTSEPMSEGGEARLAGSAARGDTLAAILADKRGHIARRKQRHPLAEVDARAFAAEPPRGFAAALQARLDDESHGLIAEIKRASPSRGLIRAHFDPAALARAYREGGAACLSVLTDTPWFQGQDADLRAAHAAVPLPVLRKDFILDPYQVVEARALGADCILLIMAALDLPLARELEAAAIGLGMDVLVEVHDRAELDLALELESRLIGINNRDLRTLEVDLDRSIALAAAVPSGYLLVAESGIRTRADLERLAAHGIGCFLVGESLMAQADVAKATRALLEG